MEKTMVMLETIIQKRYKPYANEIVDGIIIKETNFPKRGPAARSDRN
jgi:hypothetical protein